MRRMPKPRKNERITFRVTEELRKRIERAADKAGKDTGEYIRELLDREAGKAA